jgi:hypothetical protein
MCCAANCFTLMPILFVNVFAVRQASLLFILLTNILPVSARVRARVSFMLLLEIIVVFSGDGFVMTL